MTVRTEAVDVHEASEDVLRGMHLADVDRAADFYPGDPAPTLKYHTTAWLAPGGIHRNEQHWAAFDGDDVVGAARAVTWVDHEDSGLVVVAVVRAHRRQGIGSRLLDRCLSGLEAQGRSKAIIDAPVGAPTESALEHLGMKKALGERISRLTVADVDWALMDHWIATAKVRASEYDLLFFHSPIPEEHIDNWSRINDVMNSAPHEDLDLEDALMTPAKWRSMEANHAARGSDLRAAVAVHRPTGGFAGLTVLVNQQHMQWLGIQDDTGVDPAHRDKGLGRLLKASMLKRFVSEFSDVEKIETGNAGSNEPMLNINIQMGFEPVLLINAWQGEIAKARAALSV
jgi:GNAT superfamily N-acetyltransferase